MPSRRSRAERTMIPATSALIQAERRWLTLARLLVMGACLSWFGLLVWAVPSLAFDTAITDTSAAIVLVVVFSVAAAGATLASWAVWRPLVQHEAPSEFFQLLFGAQKLVRDAKQFKSRLALECRRAKDDPEQTFTVIVIRVPESAGEPRRRAARAAAGPGLPAILVRGAARADDVVAEATPSDIWLLTRGVAQDLREGVVSRLAATLRDADGDFTASAQIGAATFGEDGTQPETLLAVAQGTLTVVGRLQRARRAA